MLLSPLSARVNVSCRLIINTRCPLLHACRGDAARAALLCASRARFPWRGQNRGKKTSSTISQDDLPQGLIPLEPLALEQPERPTYPTVVQQAQDHMRKFENCVLLTRVGGFYELYFEHAEEFGPLLNLKVARRTPKNAPPFSMSGFPFFQLDRYLKILVQDLNRYVAIAEEFRNDASQKIKAGGLMNDRRVSRIITPGTLIDENFMDPLTNNYILSIHLRAGSQTGGLGDELLQSSVPSTPRSSTAVGLAWLDLSTGHFFTQSTTVAGLPSLLARIGPREIVLDQDLRTTKNKDIFAMLTEDHYIIAYTNPTEIRPISEWNSMLEQPVSAQAAAEFTLEEVAAGNSLLQYIETRLRGSEMKLQPPLRQLDVMGIDKNTMRALEIKKTMRDDVLTGSLLHTIRRTVTKGGSRLLDNWLSSPSTSISAINSRLDLVAYMLENSLLRERITTLLRRSHDAHRLLQKFAFGRGDPDDLLDLASTIQVTQDITTSLKQDLEVPHCVLSMVSRVQIDGPLALSRRIRDAIDEEGIAQQHQVEDGEAGEMLALAESVVTAEGTHEDASLLPKSSRKKRATSIREYYSDDNEAWTMKPAASSTLQHLHEQLALSQTAKSTLEADLCTRLNANSLKLRFTPGLGHICHIKGKDTKIDLSSVRSVSSSRTTRSFHHPEWTALGGRIVECKTRIRLEELRVLSSLRSEAIHNIVNLRRNGSILNELDIACSFALLAAEKNWIRPILNTETTHKIIGGRHPTVEGGLEVEGRSFVTNDCFVGFPKVTWLITGPNMAGKSTFLRQNALITILAQIGSYVPAAYAELGIVDQIFSRVGSADNLYKDQSTFMVEMVETATILKTATKRSFVIMDEIGRGTTPDDGTAVAFACLWYLSKINGCRSLFATHFHALADMVKTEGLEGVGFWCTDVEEDADGEGFRYIHKLREGVNRQSHALKVARLAGLPEEIIGMAKKVLDGRVGGDIGNQG